MEPTKDKILVCHGKENHSLEEAKNCSTCQEVENAYIRAKLDGTLDKILEEGTKEKILEEWEDEMRSILFYFWNNYKECSDVIERDEIIEKSINKLSSALSEQKENTKREIEKMKKEMNCFQDNKPGMHYECDCAEKASYNQALDDIINNI